MSKSVRLHHPTLRNANYVVELDQKYPDPNGYDCPKCNRGRLSFAPEDRLVHFNKAIHLDLDSNGDCFVAPGILELLRKVPTMAGLEVVNGTDNAPPVFVGAVEAPPQETVLLSGQQFFIPGRTKWEADRITTNLWKRQILEPLAEVHDRKVTAERAEKRTIFKLEGRRD